MTISTGRRTSIASSSVCGNDDVCVREREKQRATAPPLCSSLVRRGVSASLCVMCLEQGLECVYDSWMTARASENVAPIRAGFRSCARHDEQDGSDGTPDDSRLRGLTRRGKERRLCGEQLCKMTPTQILAGCGGSVSLLVRPLVTLLYFTLPPPKKPALGPAPTDLPTRTHTRTRTHTHIRLYSGAIFVHQKLPLS